MVNRVTPRVGPEYHKTFAITAPTTGRWWRVATCEQVQCAHYLRGWATVLDLSTELGRSQAAYIRKSSGRGFVETRDEDGAARFAFHPGQTCFGASQHRMRDFDVPELLVARDGDWRGNPTGQSLRHTSHGSWMDHLATTVDAAVAHRNKG